MMEPPSKARQQAEIAFAKTQTLSRARENSRVRADPDAAAGIQKTLRLKEARLARDKAAPAAPALTRPSDDDTSA